jgi:hypothetical protein
VLLGDRREQGTVFALVVGGQGGAEPVTEQQQVPCRWLGRLTGGQSLPDHGHCFTQPVVDAA